MHKRALWSCLTSSLLLISLFGCGDDDGAREQPDAANAVTLDGGGASTSVVDMDASPALDASPPADASAPAQEASIGLPQLQELEAVMIESYTATGVGGYAIVDYRPLLLFRDGWATRNTKLLVVPVDLAVNRDKAPESWFSWRMQDGKAQVLYKSGWETLRNQTRYPGLPEGFRFKGSFERLTGLTVLISKTFSFAEDGGYRYYAAAGSAFSDPVDDRGRYDIDGYRLVLTDPDGSTYLYALVYEPGSSVIFLNDLSYVAP